MTNSGGAGFAEIKVDGSAKLLFLSVLLYNTSDGGVYEESYYFFKNESNYIEFQRVGFKDKVSKYFSDFPELSEKILNRKFRYVDRKKIVKEYNNWVNNNLLNL